jgi:Sap, sulfolipid-1-addressing protein
MGKVIVFALLAAWNPLLLAVVPVMLVSGHPKRLMLGYLLGAYTVSITFGLVFVFAAGGSNAASATDQSVNAALNITLGAMVLSIALILALGLDERLARRKGEKKEKVEKGTPRWRRALDKGSASLAFVVGALFTLPGGRYIVALQGIDALNYSTVPTVLAVVGVNLILLALVELPLLSYVVAEDWTPAAVDRTRAWFSRNGRRIVIIAATFIGVVLLVRGLLALAG